MNKVLPHTHMHEEVELWPHSKAEALSGNALRSQEHVASGKEFSRSLAVGQFCIG